MSATDNTNLQFDIDNIQGDILVGVPKKVEEYIFLQIIADKVDQFKKDLCEIVPFVTTTRQAEAFQAAIGKSKEDAGRDHGEANPVKPLVPVVGVTIGFSNFGLAKLGKISDWNDGGIFKLGMKADVPNLADPVNPDDPKDPMWLPEWKDQVDVVIDIAGDSWARVAHRAHEIEHILGIHTSHATAKILLKIRGNVRPGKEKGHEHFGFNDGLSQPAVIGFGSAPEKGQVAVNRDVILFGDAAIAAGAPTWSKDGSILAFRHLEQLVPEFDQFLEENPIVLPGLSRKEGSELLGARLVGRWKSGAPIDITPTKDDPTIAEDPQQRNNFDFSTDKTQARCPFAAHVRKTNPRSDLKPNQVDPHRIIRRGIPFGPEVTQHENRAKKSHHSRGLAFACYQSNLSAGFHFLQQTWANRKDFPPFKGVNPGFDAIIGQNGNDSRSILGTNPEAQGTDLSLPFDFVVPKGGEYFFIPSLATLKNELADCRKHDEL